MDSVLVSFFRGRGLAGLLSLLGAFLAAHGYDVNEQTMNELELLAGAFVSSIGGLLAWISKAREKRRQAQGAVE